MDKNTNQITEPMSKLFQGRNFAFVSTLMNDGSPQVTPTTDNHIDKLAKKYLGVDKYPGPKDYPGQKKGYCKNKARTSILSGTTQKIVAIV
jgi:hypothetical protein